MGRPQGQLLSVAFVTRKKPRKEIPNQKSALRIGRANGGWQKVSRQRGSQQGGRRLVKWGGKERGRERGTIFLFHLLFGRRGGFDVYDRVGLRRRDRAGVERGTPSEDRLDSL